VSVLPVGWELLAVRRGLHDAPFAVTCDGTVLPNVTQVRRINRLEEALALPQHTSGNTFVGVAMTRRELKAALKGLGSPPHTQQASV